MGEGRMREIASEETSKGVKRSMFYAASFVVVACLIDGIFEYRIQSRLDRIENRIGLPDDPLDTTPTVRQDVGG